MRLHFKPLKRRAAGLLLVALGTFALSAPLMVAQWSLALLGIPLMVLSVTEAYAAFTSARRAEAGALPSLLAMLAGNLLLLSSALVVNGLLILLFAIPLFDGLGKILTVARGSSAERLPTSGQRARRLRVCGAALVSEPHRRGRTSGRHHRRSLYSRGGLANADGANRDRSLRHSR